MSKQRVLIFIIAFWVTIYAMDCEDGLDKRFEDWLLLSQKKLFNELDEIKSAIEDINSWSNSGSIKTSGVPIFDIRVDTLPARCALLIPPNSCAQATACTKRSGYYNIKIDQLSNATILVECDVHTEGGDWTIIQRRQDGSVDFDRTWDEYKYGFGDIEGEFFIGLDKMHALTNYYGPQELLISLQKSDMTTGYAKFNSFAIGNESEKFRLKRIGQYSGTAGNSLQRHVGKKFTTKDQDNDILDTANCAVEYTGAWWHADCYNSHLNAVYGQTRSWQGINWKQFNDDPNDNPTTVIMMIRRRRY